MTAPYRLPGPPALSRTGVDRAAERRGDREWLDRVWADPATRVLVVAGGKAAVRRGSPVLVEPGRAPAGERYLLGVDAAGVAYGAVAAAEESVLPGPAAGLREVGALLDDRDVGLLTHALALANWHQAHAHCPRCGAATVVEEAGHLRRCPVDGSEHYPRTDPAVIVLVTDGRDRALLGRQARWPPGRFSTLAGFVEPGESLEQTVRREVLEESGVPVEQAWYAGSQAWPFPSSLMVAFYAVAGSVEPRPDGEELSEVRWFSRAELAFALAAGDVLLPPPVSIARRLVEGWYGEGLHAGRGAWR